MHPELSHARPLKLFLIFNKAIRCQLGELHRSAMTRVNSSQDVDFVDRSMADQYRFLGLVYMHDLNAKNEVIYSALDARMENNSVQNHINIQQKWEDDSMKIGCQREFVSLVENLKQLVTQNMAKEEVLTLLFQHFNLEELAHLVCQYLCSIPVYVLSKLLPWLSLSLSSREYRDLLDCLGAVIPNEPLLQQAIFNMIERNGDFTLNMERVKRESQRAESLPIDAILLWHNAIKDELNETLEMVKCSGDFTAGPALDERLKVLAEICIFQSIAKDTVVFPAVYGEAFSFRQRNEVEIKFNELRLLLETAREASHYSPELYSKLCSSCGEITETINRHFYVEESQVLPHARATVDVEKQREILYQSLLVMPLRLIERVLPWLVGTMTGDEAKRFLLNMQLAAPASETGLILLFRSWAAKSSSERSFDFNEESSPQSSNLEKIPPENFKIGQDFLFPASETTETDLNISHVISVGCVDYPIDVVFEFHKAIRRDLEYLSVESGKIGDGDEAFVCRFTERFHLFWGLHKAHCSFEDNIIYPALDSRKSLRDFTRSYSLDHQREETMFEEISRALESRKTADSTVDLSAKIQVMCDSIRVRVDQHMLREERELWPLLRSRFSEEEQNKMVGFVLGTTGANALRLLLPWLTSALSQDERKKAMDTLKHVTKNTMFGDWLGECSSGNPAATLRDSTSASFDGRRRKNPLRRYMASHWIASQPSDLPRFSENVLGRSPSYRDLEEKVFGCEHFKRNCKLRAACCGDLFPCNTCHDSVCNHPMDRKATTEMMCMRCLVVQPVGQICTTPSCNGLPMAKYACLICKVFDDERNIYHCPFCNVCRVGKGLGVDYFHCMSCNCCMSIKLVDHTCKPNCLEASCPACDEFMFTSTKPVRALPCGHFIHSDCFKGCKSIPDYSCLICSKSSEEKANEKPETKISVCNHIEKEEMEISSWAAHKYRKRVFGFYVDRLWPSLKGKKSVLVCGFVLSSFIVFLLIAILVVFLSLKLLTPNDYVFSL